MPIYALTSLVNDCRQQVNERPELLSNGERTALKIDALGIFILLGGAIVITLQCNGVNVWTPIGSWGMAPAYALYGYAALMVIADLAKFAVHAGKLYIERDNQLNTVAAPLPPAVPDDATLTAARNESTIDLA